MQSAEAPSSRSDAVDALLALGYNEREAQAAVKQLPADLQLADAIRQALLAGADTFLAKPIPTENLRAELQRWSAGRLLSAPLSWDRALAQDPLSS